LILVNPTLVVDVTDYGKIFEKDNSTEASVCNLTMDASNFVKQ